MTSLEWGPPQRKYLDMSSVMGSLLSHPGLRDIALAARDTLQVAFAAVSFGPTEVSAHGEPAFSAERSMFVRDTWLVPMDFAPCAATAVRPTVHIVSDLAAGRPRGTSPASLRSYAGYAVHDRHERCIAVFYVMDTRPRRFSTAALASLGAYTHLVGSQIEIVRRFGINTTNPSPRHIIRRADEVACLGEEAEARALIALAYAAHDIGRLRRLPAGVELR